MHEASCPEEPGAGKLHAGICEGGAGQPASLPQLMAPGATEPYICEAYNEDPMPNYENVITD